MHIKLPGLGSAKGNRTIGSARAFMMLFSGSSKKTELASVFDDHKSP
jgi:hypothetical protein